MDIYVVQPGDTIYSIADKYGVPANQIIQDNELANPYDLVVGQTIVIVYPKQVYMVQEGDTLESIASSFGITVMQLLMNNPFLSSQNTLDPGEQLVISYNTSGSIMTNGFVYPFINRDTLIKTLPNLTFLTIYNYRASRAGDLIAYYDDSEIIRIAKEYDVVPLMMTTTLSLQGEPNIELAYEILLNEEFQDMQINRILEVLRSRGYYGVNMLFNYINETNHELYERFITKVASRVHEEGYLYYATFNLKIDTNSNNVSFRGVDYSLISRAADGIIFMQFIWGTNNGPPMPVSNMINLRTYIKYAAATVPQEKIILGSPIISYDWNLPYIPGRTVANSLTIDAAIDLARNTNSVIQFDEISLTPYFYYSRIGFEEIGQHIVWSIDARSINALFQIVADHNLVGTGIWNIMIYYAWVWLLLRSQFNVVKLLPETHTV